MTVCQRCVDLETSGQNPTDQLNLSSPPYYVRWWSKVIEEEANPHKPGKDKEILVISGNIPTGIWAAIQHTVDVHDPNTLAPEKSTMYKAVNNMRVAIYIPFRAYISWLLPSLSPITRSTSKCACPMGSRMQIGGMARKARCCISRPSQIDDSASEP